MKVRMRVRVRTRVGLQAGSNSLDHGLSALVGLGDVVVGDSGLVSQRHVPLLVRNILVSPQFRQQKPLRILCILYQLRDDLGHPLRDPVLHTHRSKEAIVTC